MVGRGWKVRRAIHELGGTMLENLRVAERIKTVGLSIESRFQVW